MFVPNRADQVLPAGCWFCERVPEGRNKHTWTKKPFPQGCRHFPGELTERLKVEEIVGDWDFMRPKRPSKYWTHLTSTGQSWQQLEAFTGATPRVADGLAPYLREHFQKSVGNTVGKLRCLSVWLGYWKRTFGCAILQRGTTNRLQSQPSGNGTELLDFFALGCCVMGKAFSIWMRTICTSSSCDSFVQSTWNKFPEFLRFLLLHRSYCWVWTSQAAKRCGMLSAINA